MTGRTSLGRIRKNPAQRFTRRIVAFSGERGAGLIESLIAVTIVGVALVTFLAAFSTGSMAVTTIDKHVTAENLARAQVEDIMGQTYAASYSTLTEPTGYTISVTVSAVNGRDQNQMQKITITVSYDNETMTVEAYKVNR